MSTSPPSSSLSSFQRLAFLPLFLFLLIFHLIFYISIYLVSHLFPFILFFLFCIFYLFLFISFFQTQFTDNLFGFLIQRAFLPLQPSKRSSFMNAHAIMKLVILSPLHSLHHMICDSKQQVTTITWTFKLAK